MINTDPFLKVTPTEKNTKPKHFLFISILQVFSSSLFGLCHPSALQWFCGYFVSSCLLILFQKEASSPWLYSRGVEQKCHICVRMCALVYVCMCVPHFWCRPHSLLSSLFMLMQITIWSPLIVCKGNFWLAGWLDGCLVWLPWRTLARVLLPIFRWGMRA